MSKFGSESELGKWQKIFTLANASELLLEKVPPEGLKSIKITW